MRRSIRRRLTITFVVLSVSPLVMLGIILAWPSLSMQVRQAQEMQREIAKNMAGRIMAFLAGQEKTLDLLSTVEDLTALDVTRLRGLLATLCAFDGNLDEVALLDANGRERVRYSRFRSLPSVLGSRSSSDEFRVPMAESVAYYGPIEFELSTGEPSLSLAIPVMDVRSGRPVSVLAAKVRIKRIWELIAEERLGRGQELYIVDQDDRIIAHRNPSIVLKGTRFPIPPLRSFVKGLSGNSVIMGMETVRIGRQELHIVAEQNVFEALALGIQRALTGMALVFAALAGSILVGLLIVRHITVPLKDMAETAKAISEGEMSRRVAAHGKDEFGLLAQAFNSMAAQLDEFIGKLESRVAERTAQLEASNKELESFSYSVSHDLRAPLRSMNGFARILLEDHAATLSPEAARMVQIIKTNSLQMSRLIDDLLALSRLGRQPLTLQRVDMADLAHQALESLRGDLAGRRIEIRWADLPPCACDPGLMSHVWINLLSNAIKFTRRQETAEIQVGSQPGPDQKTTYYVKDNGVGFDMRYTSRLFEAFQRLHAEKDFEGTGIGLAIVRRVVARHGGRTWAEAEVDRGASVYFSL
jgi:signal transduction histidine kinase